MDSEANNSPPIAIQTEPMDPDVDSKKKPRPKRIISAQAEGDRDMGENSAKKKRSRTSERGRAGPSNKPDSEENDSPPIEIKTEPDADEDSPQTARPKRMVSVQAEVDSETDEDSAKKKRSRPSERKRVDNRSRGPFNKPTLTHLKRTGESFLQDGPCFDVAPKLVKCRECRLPENQSKDKTSSNNIFCRFYAFRRLKYSKFGILLIAGFSNPFNEPNEADLNLWLPSPKCPPPDLTLPQARFLLTQVGNQFCDLLAQENEAKAAHMSKDMTIAWKRVVKGVREMCDVCETSLFNYHWTCRKCGFVVCLDCYKGRKAGLQRPWCDDSKHREVDSSSWLLCAQRTPHDQERLMLTQIIAGNSLQELGRLVHTVRSMWRIGQHCGCPLSKESPELDAESKEVIDEIIANQVRLEDMEELARHAATYGIDPSTSQNQQPAMKPLDVYSSDDEDHAMLRAIVLRNKKNKRPKIVIPTQRPLTDGEIILEAVLSRNKAARIEQEELMFTQHRRYLPIRIMTYAESNLQYPDVPHKWLCDGKLLRLVDPLHPQNVRPFQEQWKRGMPVMVSNVSDALNMAIWRPESFSKDFGDDKNDLVNCMSGNLVPNQPMKRFWDGFDYVDRRLKDANRKPMLLKLKDWPPGEDFAEILPTRYIDLMKNLPLGDYTKRNGKYNLASRLPNVFVKPDLGPKMYNAYGSALHPDKGTTNLHLDISDAVNLMVYVGISRNSGEGDLEHIRAAYRAVDEAGCDIITRRRVREPNELPGAIWHIYAPRDADKIRDLLNKVSIERGRRLEPNHDSIHDQSWYLDGPLRERLYNEYSVEGYPIAQCRGDAIFIPAGAPHQVRNLHNCVKVAEDFVSPEHVSHCFHLTQEFRNLSDTHSNHEDKLQIKNIIYHAVKDAVAGLSNMLRTGLEDRQLAGVARVKDEPVVN